MNVGQWVSEIAEAIGPEADREASRCGPTQYDELIRLVQDRSAAGEEGEIVRAVLEVARTGKEQDEYWWQRLLNILQHTPETHTLISEAETREIFSLPESAVVKAYILQRLTATGAAVNWDRIERLPEYAAMLAAAPLVLADALIRADHLHLASLVLEEAILREALTAAALNRQYERWKSLGFRVPHKPALEQGRIDLAFLHADFFPAPRWAPVTPQEALAA